ncbi:hypothetical protein FDECE_1885 [Fusarium decemcellulare]|nr:hypothetical protein FDECE_1885 [Fusarium decemcellulare]
MSFRNHRDFIGSAASGLPTPSLIVKKSVVEENIAQIHREVDVLGIGFRPQLETLKLPKIVWALPVTSSKLQSLSAARSLVRVVLRVDNDEHIEDIEQFKSSDPTSGPWPVFINVDVGTRQASVPVHSERLESVVRYAEKSEAVEVLGFHADGRYSFDPISNLTVRDNLPGYIEGLFEEVKSLGTDRKVTVSIEVAPTAFSLSLKDKAPANVQVDLYAGNYSSENLAHMSTGLVSPFHQALRLLVEVCSVSPESNVALSDGGKIAYKELNSVPAWSITALSRKDGLIGYMDPIGDAAWDGMRDVEAVFKLGQKQLFDVTEASIAVPEHRVCYLVGDDDVVLDIWDLWE